MRPLTLALLGCGWLAPALAFADPPSVDTLLRQLRSSDALERRAAAKALANARPLPVEAAPYLVDALKDWRLRPNASRALINMGPLAVPSLLRFLDEPTPSRGYQIDSFRDHGIFVDWDGVRVEWPQRAAVIQTLARLGPAAVPDLIKAAKDHRPSLRQGAVKAMAAMQPPDGRALPVLTAVLMQPQPKGQLPNPRWGQGFAGGFGGDFGGGIGGSGFELVIRDDPHRTRSIAAFALSAYKSKGVPYLLEALAKQGRDVRAELFFDWPGLGSEMIHADLPGQYFKNPQVTLATLAKEAPKLVAYWRDPHGHTRVLALQGLRQAGHDSRTGTIRFAPEDMKQVLPALVKALKDRDTRVRIEAASLLGAMGEQAEPAIPALLEALRDGGYTRPLFQTQQSVLGAVAKALTTMGGAGEDALAHQGLFILADRLQDADGYARGHAADALGSLGKKARTVVPQLLRVLGEDSIRFAEYSKRAEKLGQNRWENLEEEVLPIQASQYKTNQALKEIGLDIESLPTALALLEEKISTHDLVKSFLSRSKVSVPELLKRARFPDEPARRQAAGTLARLAPSLEQLCRDLQEALDQSQFEQVEELAHRILLQDPKSPQAFRALGLVLRFENYRGRSAGGPHERILRLLERHGSHARPAAPALSQFIHLPSRLEKTEDRDAEFALRCQGAVILVRLDSDQRGAALSLLRDWMRGGSAPAAMALAQLDPDNADVLAALLQPLKQKGNRAHHGSLIASIGLLKGRAKPAVPLLMALLGDMHVGQQIAETLSAIGPEAAEAIPTVKQTLEGLVENAYMGVNRQSLLNTLAEVGPGNKAVIDDLLARLEDPEDIDAVPALRALAKMGPPAKAAGPRLERLLDHKDVGLHALEALLKIHGPRPEYVARLIKALDHAELHWSPAAGLVTQVGPAAQAAVPALRRCLSERRDPELPRAMEALGAIGPDAASAVPDLLSFLEHRDWSLRHHAAEALGRIGSDKALPPLAVLLEQEEVDDVIQAARQAVMTIQANKRFRVPLQK